MASSSEGYSEMMRINLNRPKFGRISFKKLKVLNILLADTIRRLLEPKKILLLQGNAIDRRLRSPLPTLRFAHSFTRTPLQGRFRGAKAPLINKHLNFEMVVFYPDILLTKASIRSCEW